MYFYNVINYKKRAIIMDYDQRIDIVSKNMNLSAYQIYVLRLRGRKYDFSSLIKIDDVLIARYLCNDNQSVGDGFKRLLYGPKFDLIGPDNLIAVGIRRSKIYYALQQNL